MKKKILSLIMAVCIVSTCMLTMGVSASAANPLDPNPRLAVSVAHVKEGESVDVTVTADNDFDLACLVLTPQFSHQYVYMTDMERNIEDGTFLFNDNTAHPKFIWYSATNHSFKQGDVLFTIHFSTTPRMGEQSIPITLTFDTNNICDENGELMELEVVDGAVQTFLFIIGDTDGNLSVTGADVVMLSRYLIGLEKEITQGADVNKDGSIDGRDLVNCQDILLTLIGLTFILSICSNP